MSPSASGRIIYRILAGTLLAGLAAHALHTGLGVGGAALDSLFNDFVYNALELGAAGGCLARAVFVREARVAWLFMGLGLLGWACGEIWFTLFLADLEEPPFPSVADALYVSIYPASYIGLWLLVRARLREMDRGLWLDGIIAAFAVTGVVAAIVFHQVMAETGGSFASVATNLAYPVGDLLLLAMVVGVIALTGWRPGRTWLLVALGFACTAVADTSFLYQTATESYEEGTIMDTLWPAGNLLIAYAAWQPAQVKHALKLEGWRLLALPATFALVATALITYDHFHRINAVALALAAATLLAVIGRMVLTLRDNLVMLARSRVEAMQDALTGLGNRRAVMSDLDKTFRAARRDAPRALLMFDLDGFKNYNDTFGHPAGDALLQRLSGKLEAAVTPWGTAYRMGGDEFCALVTTGGPGLETILAACSAALTEGGDGFFVQASYGAVVIPHEAAEPALALHMADSRMYNQKDSRPKAARRQTRDVLLQVLREREPDLSDHLLGVTDLALAVGRELALGSEQLDELARAAELHDVGKMAIPDAILNKPSALDQDEWTFMRRHTVFGQRILSAAPALAPVARLVRSSHERWDGKGYPDGLAAEEIPLGARIVAVCDAYHAMTTDRPYSRAATDADAIAELRRCSGTQFDPAVVEAFCRTLERDEHSDVARLLALRIAGAAEAEPSGEPDPTASRVRD